MNYRNTKHISPSAYLLMLICMICACTCPLHAQESCYEQYLREHNMSFLTAEAADDSYEELKKEVLARQTMRRDALFQPLMLAVDTISGTCHLLAQDGSLIADVHLALVDSTWYMWLSVDPLADKNISNSPYMYCNGNPIMLIDPDGRDLEIVGDEASSGFKQLQASTHLKLEMDESGSVNRVGGIAWTKADRELNRLLKDHNVLVTLKSVKAYFTDNGKWFAGGAFAGSSVEADGRIHTLQYLNPNDMVMIDIFTETKLGVGALHEVLESYYGGLIQPGCGIPTFDTHSPEYEVYQKAHNQAKAADKRHKEPTFFVDTQKGLLYLLNRGVELILHEDEIFKVK